MFFFVIFLMVMILFVESSLMWLFFFKMRGLSVFELVVSLSMLLVWGKCMVIMWLLFLSMCLGLRLGL